MKARHVEFATEHANMVRPRRLHKTWLNHDVDFLGMYMFNFCLFFFIFF